MAQTQLLFAGSWHNIVGGDWVEPSSINVGSGQGEADTTGCFFSGPKGCVIEDIYYVARDVDIYTDPGEDVHVGWRVRYSSDGGVSHTTLATVWASADCPLFWDDSESDYGDFVQDMPVRAHSFYGAGTGSLTENFYGTIAVPANVHVMIEIAPVSDEAHITLGDSTWDAFDVMVYGYLKG